MPSCRCVRYGRQHSFLHFYIRRQVADPIVERESWSHEENSPKRGAVRWTSSDGICNGVIQTVAKTSYIGVVHRKRSVSPIRHTFISHTLSDDTVPYQLLLENIYRNRGDVVLVWYTRRTTMRTIKLGNIVLRLKT
uniref:Uncharacterized protein n=1 Tax=Hyaloperonospora arabidopsidis (strain Emoy2) TaxID=559515 RepID=M4B3W8_HYAAE